MTLLLDTCAFIWLTQEPEKLSAAAQAAINDSSNSLVFSHASAWEIHPQTQRREAGPSRAAKAMDSPAIGGMEDY